MTEQELFQMRDLAEAGQVQFKECANDRYDIGCDYQILSNEPFCTNIQREKY